MELRFGERHTKVNWQVFFEPAFRFGYTNNLYVIADVIRNRDSKLWNTVVDTLSYPFTY